MSELTEILLASFSDAKSERSNYDVRNQDVVDYVVTNRGDFLKEVTVGGEERMDLQYDSTATIAAQDLTSILFSGLIRNDWFKFEFENQDEEVPFEVKTDLEKLSRAALNRFKSAKNNFNLQAQEFIQDIVHFGYACMQKKKENNSSIYQTIHPAQVWFEENDKGEVDVVYRQYKLTLRQAHQRWGEAIGQKAMKQLMQKPSDKIKIVHCVMPSDDYIRMGGEMKNKTHKFASIVFIPEDKHIIKNSGFKDMPYIIARWNKRSGEVYGIGLTGQVISYIKLLNVLIEVYIKSEEKAVDPPMLTIDDLPFLPLETFPGGINPGGLNEDGTPTIAPFPSVGTRGSKIDVVIQMVKKAIESAYFVEQFREREGVQPLTATETLDNRDKRLTLIAPYSERLKTEWLDKVILFEAENATRGMNISSEIENREIIIRYLGTLSFTENSERLLSYNRFFANAASFIQLDPNVIQNIKIDDSIRQIAELAGIPLDLIKSADEVEKERAVQQAQQQALEQQARLESSAKSAKDLSSAGIDIT